MSEIFLKVCGLRDPDNIREVICLKPDFAGFIFHPGSPRYAGKELPVEIQSLIPPATRKVGVFVDHAIREIIETAGLSRLDFVQLHGNESPSDCMKLKNEGIKIIKSFRVQEPFDFGILEPYLGIADYFLFDTLVMDNAGGSGKVFNWEILEGYPYEVPFFLSGGISLENADLAFSLPYPMMKAIDVNSRFEISPGIKDTAKLRELKKKLSHLNKEYR